MIDTYDKLTIGKYLDIQVVLEKDGEETTLDIDKEVQILSILSDIEEDKILEMPITEFNKMVSKTSFLMEEPPKKIVATKYKLGGMELETFLNVKNMIMSQFIDYQTFLKDKKYLVELLSVFLIPKGCKYNDGYDIVEVQRVIRDNLSIVDAMSLSAFFLHQWMVYAKVTMDCLIKGLKKEMKKEKNTEVKEKMKEAIQNLETSGGLLYGLTE